MTHIYQVSGMTCVACAKKITDKVQGIEGIQSVQVDWPTKKAVVTMTRHVETGELNRALREVGDYVLSAEGESMAPQTSRFSQFMPLILIVSGILAVSALKFVLSGRPGPEEAMLDFMGVFFIVFGGFKLLDLRGFAEAYATYDLVAKKSHVYGLLYPFIELGLGFGYLLRWNLPVLNMATFIVMGIGSIGVAQALRSKRKFQCACLGTKIKLPMTVITLLEDGLMALMAAGMLLKYAIL